MLRLAGGFSLVLLLTASAAAHEAVGATPIQDEIRQPLLADWSMSDDDLWLDGTEERPTPAASGQKSILTAGLLSFLLPGAGEYYLGHRKRATYFFVAEGLIWTSFAAFRIYGDWKEDDYIRLGETRAGASLEGKDDEFLGLVGFYNSVDEYNTAGRVIAPERPFYDPNDPSTYWRWASEADRQRFRELRNESRESYRRADFALGAALLNRIVSTIDAVLLGRRIRNTIDDGWSVSESTTLKLSTTPLDPDEQLRVTVVTDLLP